MDDGYIYMCAMFINDDNDDETNVYFFSFFSACTFGAECIRHILCVWIFWTFCVFDESLFFFFFCFTVPSSIYHSVAIPAEAKIIFSPSAPAAQRQLIHEM